MALHIGFGDVVALLALGLSAYSLKKTLAFNKRQSQFEELEYKLNKLLLRKEDQDALSNIKADVSANFVRMGKDEYRLKVFNKGKNPARNVRIEFPEGNEILIGVDDKFPVPILEQYQTVELIAALDFQSSSRLSIRLIWNDDSGNDNTKELTPTIP